MILKPRGRKKENSRKIGCNIARRIKPALKQEKIILTIDRSRNAMTEVNRTIYFAHCVEDSMC